MSRKTQDLGVNSAGLVVHRVEGKLTLIAGTTGSAHAGTKLRVAKHLGYITALTDELNLVINTELIDEVAASIEQWAIADEPQPTLGQAAVLAADDHRGANRARRMRNSIERVIGSSAPGRRQTHRG